MIEGSWVAINMIAIKARLIRFVRDDREQWQKIHKRSTQATVSAKVFRSADH
jgi:hypothetical protein